MKIGELIAQYRTEHGFSQRQFALLCDLSNGYISMLERGFNPATKKPVTPKLDQIKKLADGMGMTVMDLLDRVDDMPIDISSPTPASEHPRCIVVDPPHPAEPSGQYSEEEQELIRKFRCLDERGQSAVLNVLNFEYSLLPGEEADSVAKKA